MFVSCTVPGEQHKEMLPDGESLGVLLADSITFDGILHFSPSNNPCTEIFARAPHSGTLVERNCVAQQLGTGHQAMAHTDGIQPYIVLPHSWAPSIKQVIQASKSIHLSVLRLPRRVAAQQLPCLGPQAQGYQPQKPRPGGTQ